MKPTPALKLAPTVHPASLLHQQFQELSCYKQVVAHIKQGFSFEYVRDLIQDKSGEWKEHSSEVVIERVAKLQYELSKIDAVNTSLPGYAEEAAQELENGLNELKEIKYLYDMQKARIEIQFKTEQKMNILNNNTRNEIRLAKDLVESSQAIKSAIGVARAKGQPQVGGSPVIPTSSTPGGLDPKNVNRILGSVKLLMEKAKKE